MNKKQQQENAESFVSEKRRCERFSPRANREGRQEFLRLIIAIKDKFDVFFPFGANGLEL